MRGRIHRGWDPGEYKGFAMAGTTCAHSPRTQANGSEKERGRQRGGVAAAAAAAAQLCRQTMGTEAGRRNTDWLWGRRALDNGEGCRAAAVCQRVSKDTEV